MSAATNLILKSATDLQRPGEDVERFEVKNFRGQYQAADQWCWAAAAASVHATYCEKDLAATQCKIVDQNIVGANAACAIQEQGLCSRINPGVEDCTRVNPCKNRPGFLNLALSGLGILERSIVLHSGQTWEMTPHGAQQPITIGDDLDFDEIKLLIHHGHLVCLRIVRREFRHFIVIYGYESYPDNDVLVWDPAEGPDVVDFDILERIYGPFTHKIIARSTRADGA